MLAHINYATMGREAAKQEYHEGKGQRSARNIQQTRMKGMTDDLQEQFPQATDADLSEFRDAFYEEYARLQDGKGKQSSRLMYPNGKGYRESRGLPKQ